MCYSDFRKLFSKLFVCIDFPESFIGFMFYDNWTKEESGGLPINNTQKEFSDWSKNPQYYLKLNKESEVMISIMQEDGRLNNSKFPFGESTRKCCLVISFI